MKKKSIIYILIIIILILVIIVFHMYISDMNRMKHGEAVKYSNWGYAYATMDTIKQPDSINIQEISFIRTYKIICKIEKSNDMYNYYVIEQFQNDDLAVIKVNKQYNLQNEKNYEFTFKGYKKISDHIYSISDIFNDFSIISIKLTEKIGLDQIQDEI